MPIYISLTPGATITDSTTCDAATLNLLGSPTVNITGSIDGASSIVNAPGSITNAMLDNMGANTVKGADTSGPPVNLTMHSTMDIASGALKVADGGITSTQLASASTVAAGAIADSNIATGKIGINKLAPQKALTILGNGGDTASASAEEILIGSGITVTNEDEKATTTRARSSNVATIGVTAHGYSVGDKVNVTGMTDTTFNAYGVAITAVNADDFSYANVGDPVGSGADTGGKVRRIKEADGTPTSTISATGSASSSPHAWGTFFPKSLTGVAFSVNTSTGKVTGTEASHNIKVGDTITLSLTQVSGLPAGDTGTYRFVITAVTSGTYAFNIATPFAAMGNGTTGNYTRSMIVRLSSNIATIVRADTGKFTINFTNTAPSNNMTTICSATKGYNRFLGMIDTGGVSPLPSSGSIQIQVYNSEGNLYDTSNADEGYSFVTYAR